MRDDLHNIADGPGAGARIELIVRVLLGTERSTVLVVDLGWPTPHIFRHSRTTIMLRAGAAPVEVAEYLSMSSAMVLKRYGHTPSVYQKAAAAT